MIEPEIGKRYTATLRDCCIEGSFTATLTGREPQYEGDEAGTLTFDNGVVLTNWAQVAFTEETVPFEAKVQPYGDRDYTQADADSFVGKPFSVRLDEPHVDRLFSGEVQVESAEVSPDGRWLILRGRIPHPSHWTPPGEGE